MSYERDERVFADGVGQPTRMTGLLFAGSLGIPTRASAALGRSEQQVLRSWRLCESNLFHLSLSLGPGLGVADGYSLFGVLFCQLQQFKPLSFAALSEREG
jgi:hypothetical protein